MLVPSHFLEGKCLETEPETRSQLRHSSRLETVKVHQRILHLDSKTADARCVDIKRAPAYDCCDPCMPARLETHSDCIGRRRHVRLSIARFRVPRVLFGDLLYRTYACSNSSRICQTLDFFLVSIQIIPQLGRFPSLFAQECVRHK